MSWLSVAARLISLHRDAVFNMGDSLGKSREPYFPTRVSVIGAVIGGSNFRQDHDEKTSIQEVIRRNPRFIRTIFMYVRGNALERGSRIHGTSLRLTRGRSLKR